MEYLQEKTLGQPANTKEDPSRGNSKEAPGKSDVRDAHPEKIQEFIRDKYKSDANDFPDVKNTKE